MQIDPETPETKKTREHYLRGTQWPGKSVSVRFVVLHRWRDLQLEALAGRVPMSMADFTDRGSPPPLPSPQSC